MTGSLLRRLQELAAGLPTVAGSLASDKGGESTGCLSECNQIFARC